LDRMTEFFRIEENGISKIEGKGALGSGEQGRSQASFNLDSVVSIDSG